MDFDLPLLAEDLAFRAEVRQFLEANLPAGWGTSNFSGPRTDAERVEQQKDWQRRLFDAGLVAISWPRDYGGRAAGFIQQLIFSAEMARRRAPEPINRSALNHTGPTLIQWGNEWQKERFLPGILSGAEVWCQGFSEPSGGSDLAALKTRAVLDGDEFVVTGTKIWTSRAHYSDWCYLLVRTDPNTRRHEGISCLLVDMHSPGITVRPIKQISGQSNFNQVFFDEVRVPRRHLVGEPNQGWKIVTSTLSYERAGLARPTRVERRLDIVTQLAQQLLVDGQPRVRDPLVQDRLARYSCKVEALRHLSTEVSLASLQGADPGPEASIAKLIASETDQSMSEYAMELAGPYSVLMKGSAHAIKRGNVPLSYLILRAATMGGGTSEIQRNVIGERVLGLPKA